MFVEDLSEAGESQRTISPRQPSMYPNDFVLEEEKTFMREGISGSFAILGTDVMEQIPLHSTPLPNVPKQASLKHTIVLSLYDSIVPIGPVSRYLEAKLREGHTCLEVVFFHGHHGEMMLYPSWVQLLTKKIRQRCNLED